MEEHPSGQKSTCKRIPHAQVVWVEDIKFIPRGMHRPPLSPAIADLCQQRTRKHPSSLPTSSLMRYLYTPSSPYPYLHLNVLACLVPINLQLAS